MAIVLLACSPRVCGFGYLMPSSTESLQITSACAPVNWMEITSAGNVNTLLAVVILSWCGIMSRNKRVVRVCFVVGRTHYHGTHITHPFLALGPQIPRADLLGVEALLAHPRVYGPGSSWPGLVGFLAVKGGVASPPTTLT